MSELSALQRQFGVCLAKLLDHITESGFEFTLGEGYRTTEQAEINALPLIDRKVVEGMLNAKYPDLAKAIGISTSHGIRASNHRNRLAQDLNIYKDGVWLTGAESYKPFGAWWKLQHPSARWGGDFDDADHFSFEYNGVK
jgi:hypothetical protein